MRREPEAWVHLFAVEEIDDPTVWERVVDHFRTRMAILIPLGMFLAAKLALSAQQGTLGVWPWLVLGGVIFAIAVRLIFGGRKREAKARLRRAHALSGVIFSINLASEPGQDHLLLHAGELFSITKDGFRTKVDIDKVVLPRGRSSGRLIQVRMDSGPPRFMKVYRF